jgi:hypothetical protein
MMSLVGNRVRVLREIGIGDNIFFLSDVDLFLFSEINLVCRLLLAAVWKTKETYEKSTPKSSGHHRYTSKSTAWCVPGLSTGTQGTGQTATF